MVYQKSRTWDWHKSCGHQECLVEVERLFMKHLKYLSKRIYGQATDFWSLGIVLLERLLSRRIFKLTKDTLQPGLRGDFPSQSWFQDIKDKELKELVKKMLMKKPEDRLSSEQMLDLLNGKKGRQQYIPIGTQKDIKLQQLTEQRKKVIELQGECSQLKIKLKNQTDEKNRRIQQDKKQQQKLKKQTKDKIKLIQQKQEEKRRLKIQLQKQKQEKIRLIIQQKEEKRQIYIIRQQLQQFQLNTIQYKHHVSTSYIFYRFSQKYKFHYINIFKNNTKAFIVMGFYGYGLVLVEGAVFEKGSSISFRIQQTGQQVGFGLAISNFIVKNQYLLSDPYKIGHGCFLLFHFGWSYSHSNKEHNNVNTDFKYNKGEVIKVERNGDELWWRNQTTNKDFRMKVNLTLDEWAQVCFCVYLRSDSSKPALQIVNRVSGHKNL